MAKQKPQAKNVSKRWRTKLKKQGIDHSKETIGTALKRLQVKERLAQLGTRRDS
jgi:hypothetical protein